MTQSVVRKAVIPAAGMSTRLLPATKAQPKAMLPVVDKPAMQYVVEEAARNGLTDILIITGRTTRAVADHFDRNLELETHLQDKGKDAEVAEIRGIAEIAQIHYTRQAQAGGLGQAVGMARQHVGDEPFAVLLPDDLMTETSTVLGEMLDVYAEKRRPVLCLKQVSDDEITGLGCVAVDDAGTNPVKVNGIVEKPARGEQPSNLAVIGRYVFGPDIFESIDKVRPGKGGEVQLTDAIEMHLRDGVYGHVFEHGHYDTGNKLGYLRAVLALALERPDLGDDVRAMLGELT